MPLLFLVIMCLVKHLKGIERARRDGEGGGLEAVVITTAGESDDM